VITGRIHAPAGALLAAALIATDSLRHCPAAPRRHGHPGRRRTHQRPGTKKGSHRAGRHRQPDRTPARGHEQGRPASGSAGALPRISPPHGTPRGGGSCRGCRRTRWLPARITQPA